MGRPSFLLSAAMMSRYWSKLGTDQTPLYAVLAGRTSGSRSFARSVWSCAQVKSSVNQPVIGSAVHDLRGLEVCELRVVGHVGRAGDVVLVPADEHVVLGRHDVALDEVGAELAGQLVRALGVLRAIAGCAAVSDHDRLRDEGVHRLGGRRGDAAGVIGVRGGGERESRARRGGEDRRDDGASHGAGPRVTGRGRRRSMRYVVGAHVCHANPRWRHSHDHQTNAR